MNIVRLGDVCKVISGSTPKREIAEYWNGTIPWITPKEISRLASPYLWESAEKITETGFKSCSTAMLPVDSLLLSSRAPIGLLAINKIPVCTNQGFKSLIPNKEVNVEYLYYVLKANVSSLQARGNGATFKELGKPAVENFEIPLPAIGDQIRIAYLLGKVEGLIAQRKQHLKQLDDLLKSVFLEMFGDPVRNEKGWENGTSPIYAEMVTVGVVVKPASHYVDRGVIALRSLNIKPNRIDLSDLVYFTQESNEGVLSKSRLRANDVVIVRTGKTGTAAVVPHDLDGANCIDLIVVRPKPERINPQYLTCLLNSERGMALVSSLEVGGIQKHFNVGALNKIPFPLPPIEFQDQFAVIVKKIESLKSRYQQSLTDLENLYGALSQQAFKGELDLSRVPLPPDNDEAPQQPDQTHESQTAPATFQLPEPPEGGEWLSAENRQALIEFWLDAWFQHHAGQPFSATAFMGAAYQRLLELSERDAMRWDDPDKGWDEAKWHDEPAQFGAAEYERIKQWVFERLDQGQLIQSFDAASDNRVQIAKATS